ncbi:MAG: hypothetical protein Ta2E_00130 [Mycoplasmoidaceae bacterium]|nr:MAG: hypothetical protein Ta2E_00130 [Mycoplasmoidaceae bacterium]
MDSIDRQSHLLNIEGNEFIQQLISEQEAKIKSLQTDVMNLNKVIVQNELRMAPKPNKEHYKLSYIMAHRSC